MYFNEGGVIVMNVDESLLLSKVKETRQRSSSS